jgi:hypothetical protein
MNASFTIGNEVCSRAFSKHQKTILDSSGNESDFCINYEGFTDNSEGSSSLIFENVDCMIQDNGLLEGKHKIFSLNFIDEVKPLKLNWKFKFFNHNMGWESYIEFISGAFPCGDWRKDNRKNILDILPIPQDTIALYLTKLKAGTDSHNEFSEFSEYKLKDASELWLDGNVLRTEKLDGSGLVIIKMSPSHYDCREKIKSTFKVEKNKISIYGWGIEPHEFVLNHKMRTYSVVVIPYKNGHCGALAAIRDFFRVRWQRSFNLTPPVIINPWGGGGNYFRENISESWIIKELQATAKLGGESYQLDDGWQNGSFAALVSGKPANEKFWTVNTKKFPNGFVPLVQTAKSLNLNLGLWYSPDFNIQYANWMDGADFIVDFCEKYNLKYIKIDGAMHRSYTAETNFDHFLKRACLNSEKRIVFNLDVTAGIRMGFLYSPEFGPIFPANRYPFVSNNAANRYRPDNTLRNFWKLSHLIPPHLIQVEVPNIFHKPSDFADFDPMYCAMISFFGSPLLWLQPSRTDKKLLEEYHRMIKLFVNYRDHLHKGFVFPIGEQPNGASFSGFISHNGSKGIILIFKELTKRKRALLKIPNVIRARTEIILSNTNAKVSINEGNLEVKLQDERSFVLFSFSSY